MPVLYHGLPDTQRAMRQFRSSVSAGVVACWLMNVLWAYFILEIVPQRAAGPCHQDVANGNITLACANQHDEISTQPVVDVMKRDYRQLLWLAQLVASFILLSITFVPRAPVHCCHAPPPFQPNLMAILAMRWLDLIRFGAHACRCRVSYMTLGNAMKHMLDGIAGAYAPDIPGNTVGLLGRFWRLVPSSLRHDVFLKLLLYVACFALILLVSLLNPQSFLLVLEVHPRPRVACRPMQPP
jgi:hypothetical protein